MKNIKMGPKLIVSFMFIAALVAFMGAYIIDGLKTLNERTKLMYQKGMVPLEFLVETSQQVQKMYADVQRWQFAKTNESRAAYLKSIDDAYAVLKENITKQKDVFPDLLPAIDKYVVEVHKHMKIANTEELSLAVINAEGEMSKKINDAIRARLGSAEELLESNSQTASHSEGISIAILIMVLIFSLGYAIFLTFSITHPLRVVVHALSKIEQGNMIVRTNLQREDEFGALSKAIDSLAVKLQTMFKNLRQNSNTLADHAEELSGIGQQMTKAAEKVAVNIKAMASGAAKTSGNADKVAVAAEEMSSNMSMIASAVEEMSNSISQIEGNASDASKVANEASIKSSDATKAMSKLGVAAEEIGQVTDVIKKIADKTNLLALNATIEAASAGEAGKGFAVVAGEIKELANQSAKSADDITKRIREIQIDTGEAVTVINGVSEIIAKINQSVETISSLVGHQTKASNEIANNVAQANIGIKHVAESISEVAKGSKEMASNVEDVAKGSISVQNTTQINQGADELAKLASDLKSILTKLSL